MVDRDRCSYWHFICKDFFQDEREECPYDKDFCLVFYDFKEQEKLQRELPLEDNID